MGIILLLLLRTNNKPRENNDDYDGDDGNESKDNNEQIQCAYARSIITMNVITNRNAPETDPKENSKHY
jgi:hypothetical protein